MLYVLTTNLSIHVPVQELPFIAILIRPLPRLPDLSFEAIHRGAPPISRESAVYHVRLSLLSCLGSF